MLFHPSAAKQVHTDFAPPGLHPDYFYQMRDVIIAHASPLCYADHRGDLDPHLFRLYHPLIVIGTVRGVTHGLKLIIGLDRVPVPLTSQMQTQAANPALTPLDP